MSFDLLLLIGSVLMFFSIAVGKASSRFGVPVLLFFLLVGFAAGVDGFNALSFDDPVAAQYIGVVALVIILFSGGMDTRVADIRPIVLPGLVMATAGVLVTALVAGLFIFLVSQYWLTGVKFGFAEALLLAAVMSSTDSASVFAILRSKGLALKENLRPLLELESGSNDPMAYLLTIVLIQLLQGDVGAGFIIWTFLKQLLLGLLGGVLLGRLAHFIINRINLDNDAIYSVLLLVVAFFIYSFTAFAGGNGYLGVYVGGLYLGNRRFVHKRSSVRFFEGLTWLAQIIMFLSLGLLATPHDMIPIAGLGCVIGAFMIFCARPIATWMCLTPFRQFSRKAVAFVSFVGLRGAVPIVFATYPWIARVEHSNYIFNIVFFITLLSILLQGTLVPTVAHWLGLDMPGAKKDKLKEFDVDFSDDIGSAMAEIKVQPQMLLGGNRLIDLNLPEHTLVAMVKRKRSYFIPRGNTILEVGDTLLVMSETEAGMQQTRQLLEVGD